MEIIEIYQFGETYGLFTSNQCKDPEPVIKLCRSIAENRCENDVDGNIDLEEEFIDQLEEQGIVRIFVKHEIFI